MPANSDNAIPTDSVGILGSIADQVYELGADQGFVDAAINVDNNALVIYWSGAPSQYLRDQIEKLSTGVTLSIEETNMPSRLHLKKSSEEIIKLSESNGWEIQTIAPFVKRGSTVITVGPRSSINESDVREIQGLLEVGSIDIVRSKFEMDELLLSGRLSDTSPFKAGARTIQGGEACSSGFSVLSGGSGRLLSSRHCDTTSNLAIYNGNGTAQIASGGASVSGMASLDSQLIDPSDSPATLPRVYIGSWSSSTYSVVKNWASNWVGDSVCLSGATSGTGCGTVSDDSVTWNYGGYAINTILVEGPSGDILASSGDSGGPVYRKLSAGVQARGVISSLWNGGFVSQNCSTYAINPDVNNVICSRFVLYVPISTVLNAWGVALHVG